jgi:hypothetical protein
MTVQCAAFCTQGRDLFEAHGLDDIDSMVSKFHSNGSLVQTPQITFIDNTGRCAALQCVQELV